MRRFVFALLLAATAAALGSFACGPGNDKPPLTPDSEHTDVAEAGAPATPSTAAPAVPAAPASAAPAKK